MRKKYTQIGEAFLKIQCIQPKRDVLSSLKWNWGKVYDPIFIPAKYSGKTRILTIISHHPSIYVAHLGVEIREKCNEFLGYEAVRGVNFLRE